jgi:GMP synthase (glutamine-hydrolysing)
MAETRAKLPVLVVLHQEHSTPGRVGRLLEERGHRLDIRRPRFGDPLPSTMAEHAGAVIFGGPMSANDKDEFIRTEIEWIGVALREKAPLLGICLGAQMLAIQLGAKVDFDPEARAEIGYYPIFATEHGKCIGPLPDHVYQWHREGCELPAGARLLATSNGAFPVQAFAYGPAAIGVQFHPEITFAQVHRWTGRNNTRMQIPGACEREQHIEGHVMHGHKVRVWLDRFLTRWTKNELALA